MGIQTINIYLVNSVIIMLMLGAISGVIIFKVAYKIIELIPGM